MISFDLDEDTLAIQETVRKFAETELREKMREAEAEGGVSDAMVKRYRELGLNTLELPEQYGGLDLGMITRVIVEPSIISYITTIVNKTRGWHTVEVGTENR